MRYALILAGGSGTRLWPMSRAGQPKQLIPFIHSRSLLEIAVDRLEGVVPPERRYIGASVAHRDIILRALPQVHPDCYLGEPTGRDTLNAVAYGAAVIGRNDPDAVIAVFTADHLIEPVDRFREIVGRAYRLVEQHPKTLVTFGVTPTGPATGFGYLELAEPIDDDARVVRRFQEKPDAETAQKYFAAGPESYLWNSGMFVWRAATLLDCVRRYEPATHDALMRVAAAWDTPARETVLNEVFPTLKKISIDYAVMEPASRDPQVRVAAIPMTLDWLDVGSWPMYARTCASDEQGNVLGSGRCLLVQTSGSVVVSSDPKHIVAMLGCEDLIVVHTPDATLVCRASAAENVKELQKLVVERFGPEYS